MKISAAELANMLGGEVEGNDKIIVDRPAKIEDAVPGTITFLANPKYEPYAYTTQASVLLVSHDFTPTAKITPSLIRVPNVYAAMAVLADNFDQSDGLQAGISTRAVVHQGATVDPTATVCDFVVVQPGAVVGPRTILHPFVMVGKQVVIGADCVMHSGTKIEHNCQIGNRVIIHANTVVGSDGFGFVRSEEGYQKMKQLGNVVIEDQVEIGANAVIDRASMGSTIIKSGAKLDNLIQIAHNVEIGSNTAIAAQAGVAGSTKVGEDVLIGGQAGIVGHLKIADGTQVQAQSGVTNSTKQGDRLYGSPAIEYGEYLRSYAAFKNFSNIVSELREAKRRLEALENKLRQLQSDS